ncbi:hypothetical protein KZ844_10635, partial [Pseudomonas aeruginosa]|nr:hypothetical protein [Pseudomonas aeruginosa]
MKYSSILLLSLSLVGSTAFAGDDTRAAIGGALGGVLGSVVGDAVGGSTGAAIGSGTVSYTHLRAHETSQDLVCR